MLLLTAIDCELLKGRDFIFCIPRCLLCGLERSRCVTEVLNIVLTQRQQEPQPPGSWEVPLKPKCTLLI